MPPQAAIKWRRQAPTSPAAAILHNYPGRSPQPVREAQPVPDRTLAAQGRQARWLPQPSRPYGRVNLREYSLAPYWCREAGRFRGQFHFPPLTDTKCYCILLTYRGPKGQNYIFLTKMSDSEWFTSGFFFWTRGPGTFPGPLAFSREALIKSLSDFILGFLSNARNKSTRIASYLRRLMTQHWIKIHMKFDSAN